MTLLGRLFGIENHGLRITTTRTGSGEYKHDVRMDENDPLIRALAEGSYIADTKKTHERFLRKSGVSYTQTRISPGLIQTETRP